MTCDRYQQPHVSANFRTRGGSRMLTSYPFCTMQTVKCEWRETFETWALSTGSVIWMSTSTIHMLVDNCPAHPNVRLGKLWLHQAVKFGFTADLTGSRNRSEKVIKWQCQSMIDHNDADLEVSDTRVRNSLSSCIEPEGNNAEISATHGYFPVSCVSQQNQTNNFWLQYRTFSMDKGNAYLLYFHSQTGSNHNSVATK